MKSREPVLVHGRDTWDRINLPEHLFRERVEEIRAVMANRELDAVLVYGRGDRDGHLCYVSNLINKVPNWGLLVGITPEEVSLRNERSSRTRPVIERGTWITDIDFVDNVVADVHDLVPSVDESRIGTVGFGTMPAKQYDSFTAQVDSDRVVELDDAFWKLRSIKSRRERDQIARSGRILRDVHRYVTSSMDSPTTETALANQADRIGRLRGMRDVRCLIANPGQTEPHLRPAENHPVLTGEPVTIFTAGRFEGYWAEYARTYRFTGDGVTDPASGEAEAIYRSLLDAIRPGVTTKSVATTVEASLEDTAFELASAYDLGHGIGLDVNEPPRFRSGVVDDLEAGMALSASLVLTSEDDSLVVFNDTGVIRDSGLDVLTVDP